MNSQRWIYSLVLVVSLSHLSLAQETTKQLFNGKDLSGWKGNPELWTVQDGCITGTVTAEKPLKFNTFLIWQEGDVSDFEFDLDYKMIGNNSGIQYRSKILKADDFVVGGYQADIDASLKFSGINYEEKGRGILSQRGQKVTIGSDGKKVVDDFSTADELGKLIKKEDWNHYKIVAKGNVLSHYINDQLMSQVIDEESAKSSSSGVLALQIHVGPPMVIQFKNIVLKETPK